MPTPPPLPSKSGPPPLPSTRVPPPLPTGLGRKAETCRSNAITVSVLGTLLFSAVALVIALDGSKTWDLKLFAACIALFSWIGLIGLILRTRQYAWAAYVTFGVMLLGFPIGTILGVYGMKWMQNIYPKPK